MSSADDKVSMRSIDLSKLAEPFEESDIEWRVSRAGIKDGKPFCLCLAYCTARAIQRRLDEVCGPENWRNEAMTVHDFGKTTALQVGISIRINGEWITKWDVSEPTNIEPAKGGFSGAMKRAGAQWGIGRYLYMLDETFAETSKEGGKGWNWAVLPEKHGGDRYYWKPPKLPEWAMPKEPDHEISEKELNELKKAWKAKFAPLSDNPGEQRDGFARFVNSVCGEFPVNDVSAWLRVSYEKCMKSINDTTDPKGPSSDVPFDA
jgi:hypothetical protein